MDELLERVAKTISRYRMIAPGQRAGVAVSGGADSVCLLHALVELAPRWQLSLRVLHVDHQLRGAESTADAEFVRELAARLGLEYRCRRADVRAIAEQTGDNLEQAARRVRRKFFREMIGQGFADRVALGHTRDDQAETVLFRFLRGAGTAGLAGIRPVTTDGFVRPLIDLERSAIERWLAGRGISWRVDSTNADYVYARNRIRHALLPLLEREWNPALKENLAQTAVLAQDEEEYWAGEIDRLAREHLRVRGEMVFLPAREVAALPRAAARRLLRRAIESARGDLRRIDFGHVEAVLWLARAAQGDGRIQIPGLDVFRSFEWIRIAPPGIETIENRNYRSELPVPGRFEVPGAGYAISLELQDVNPPGAEGVPGYNSEEGSNLDWGRISGALEVRNWRPGDQYQPVGHATEAKIKHLFQQARIPLWERRKWPIIIKGDVIVWTRKFGPAAGFAATPASRIVLKVREFSDG